MGRADAAHLETDAGRSAREMKTHIAILILGVLTGCASPPPDNVQYHNPLQWHIREALQEVPSTGCFTHADGEKEAIRQAVLDVLKGKDIAVLRAAETTRHGAHQPAPFIRRDTTIMVERGDMVYNITPVVEDGRITDLKISGTPICLDIQVN